MDNNELKDFIRDLIEEEFSPRPVAIAERWRDGKIILAPGNDSQPKDVPMDIFFKKITGIRESLRVLEQKLNNHPQLSLEDKASFQSYVTKCYGSLTTFNVLFKEGKDRFVGAGKTADDKPSMSMREAKSRLGLNEYGDE